MKPDRCPRGRAAARSRRLERAARALLVVTLVLAAGAATSLLAAAPAAAFAPWEHDGTSACQPCHQNGQVSLSVCVQCHPGWKPVPGYRCWSCHQPGSDTAPLAADCSQTCHLWSETAGSYSIPFSHGTVPHLGADFAPCTQCHATSTSIAGASAAGVHHSGAVPQPPTCQDCHNGTDASAVANHDSVDPACTSCHVGMDIPDQAVVCAKCHSAATYGTVTCTDCHSTAGIFGREFVHTTTPDAGPCTQCHAGFAKHAGKVACTQCHTKAAAFHHGTATSPGAKTCTQCHAKKHAGRKIALSKCTKCHAGASGAPSPAVDHSTSISKAKTCSVCHTKQTHAKAIRPTITCQTCHKGTFHGAQQVPTSAICSTCHTTARVHASGFPCLTCHLIAVHDSTPSAGSH